MERDPISKQQLTYDTYANNEEMFDISSLDPGISVANYIGMGQVPYILQVRNANATTAGKVVLFNYDEFAFSDTPEEQNLSGVPTPGGDIRISSLISNISYRQILSNTKTEPFTTAMIKMESAGGAGLTQVLQITVTDPTGKVVSNPLYTGTYRNEYQMNNNILTIYPFVFKFDSKTKVEATIPASTTITFSFFLANKLAPSNTLIGGSQVVNPLPQGSLPSLPQVGNEVAPAIRPLVSNPSVPRGGLIRRLFASRERER